MATQNNEMAAKAKEIRETMNSQLAKTAKIQQKKQAIMVDILPAVEARLSENSAKTAEIAKASATIIAQQALIADENRALQNKIDPGFRLPVRRTTRIF